MQVEIYFDLESDEQENKRACSLVVRQLVEQGSLLPCCPRLIFLEQRGKLPCSTRGEINRKRWQLLQACRGLGF